MKNILLATTALVFTAGIASAEITFSGSGQFGVVNNTKDTGTAGVSTSTLNQEIDVKVSMSGTADSGMTFGQSFALAPDSDAFESVAGSVSMNGVTLSVGSVAEADVQGGLSDVGYSGLGADDDGESLDGSRGTGVTSTAHNVNLTYKMGDITLAYSQAFGNATTTSDINDSFAVGAKWTTGALTLGVGYNKSDITTGVVTATDGTVTSGYVKYVAGPATINAMTSTFDGEVVGSVNTVASGISIDYAMSDVLTLTVATSDTNAPGNKGTSGLGIAYNLGGGANFVAGYSATDGAGTGKTVDYARSSAGFTFSF